MRIIIPTYALTTLTKVVPYVIYANVIRTLLALAKLEVHFADFLGLDWGYASNEHKFKLTSICYVKLPLVGNMGKNEFLNYNL